MRLSGIMPLRNAVALRYPFVLAIQSLRRLCDEVVILVDPTSSDCTLARVRALGVDTIVESAWDMTNHRGHTDCEISVQTAKACDAATGDWVMSLQADEILHEQDIAALRDWPTYADAHGVTGLEMERIYFYGALSRYRVDWTLWLLRFFKRGAWKPDVDGAMRFDPVADDRRQRIPQKLYHYSRVGDPQAVAERVRNLDRFFHRPDMIVVGPIAPYDYTATRKLDTYVVGHQPEPAPAARLAIFNASKHPCGVREWFDE